MMRPFSNIFFNCARGPIRNMVLHKHCQVWTKVQCHNMSDSQLAYLTYLAINKIFANVYKIANLTGIRKNTLDCKQICSCQQCM